ncbi:MAG TPA: primary-amine oxidase [Acidimicrobiales bacterium]|nr:primary-amine oxidase [Acidimicrobiales bacterium]
MTDATVHPLDPLGPDEIRDAVRITRELKDLGERARFALVALEEPSKQEVLEQLGGTERRARVQVVDPDARRAWDGVVSLSAKDVLAWDEIEAGQPPFTFGEFRLAVAAVRADPRWQDAVRARGVQDIDSVQIDPWSVGAFGAEPETRRLARCVSYVRTTPTDNGYAHPIEGLVATVDLQTGEVVEVVDAGVVPVPQETGAYDAEVVGARSGPRTLDIVQPEGPTFEVEGQEIRWMGWHIRFSMTQTEGLVLHTVGFEDHGRLRPILYRASLSEMVVPYGDTAPGHWWKNAFDAGEYGIGKMANSLELGCDCLGEITYFDAWFADDDGEPVRIGNAVCLHEEDFGILWKHTDGWSGRSEVRRSRRLVLSSISTVGNYDYGFYWYFYLDGTIQLEVKSTGIVQTAALPPGETPAHGQRVAPDLYAPHHQHFFCFRLDVDVDGVTNSVQEVDVVASESGPDNPYGNAFELRRTPLRSERSARRRADPSASRSWWILNEAEHNRLGEPVGYRLVPGPTTCLLAAPNSSIGRRAAFATETLWVTVNSPEQRHAAGSHPNQHPGGEGLPAWTAADRSLESTDVVLWYTVGITHVARPEDWPVMPVECSGFSLKPQGFFERNPAIDLPAADHCHR